MNTLTESERFQVSEILARRANEIASFKDDLNEKSGTKYSLPGSVEMALSLEIERLRAIARKINPQTPEES